MLSDFNIYPSVEQAVVFLLKTVSSRYEFKEDGRFHFTLFPDSIFFPKDLTTNNYWADGTLVKSQTTKLLILSSIKRASIRTAV